MEKSNNYAIAERKNPESHRPFHEYKQNAMLTGSHVVAARIGSTVAGAWHRQVEMHDIAVVGGMISGLRNARARGRMMSHTPKICVA